MPSIASLRADEQCVLFITGFMPPPFIAHRLSFWQVRYIAISSPWVSDASDGFLPDFIVFHYHTRTS